MIAAIELENFKGISDRVRIELAPVTLLFGANNAGKSTVLHALHYFLECVDRSQLEGNRPRSAHEAFDSGGFGRVVHQHQLDRTISIRIELDSKSADPFPSLWDHPDGYLVHNKEVDVLLKPLWVELRIQSFPERPHEGAVAELRVGTVGRDQWLVRAYVEPDACHGTSIGTSIDVDFGHPALAWFKEKYEDWEHFEEVATRTNASVLTFRAASPDVRSPVPRTDAPFSIRRLKRPDDTPDEIRVLQGLRPSHEAWHVAVPLGNMGRLLDLLLVGPVAHVTRALRNLVHVGPLRTVPSRAMVFETAKSNEGWGDGLRAWGELFRSPQLLDLTNHWFDRMEMDASLVARQYFASPYDAGHPGIGRLMVGMVGRTGVRFPCELGVGFAQLVPIVAAALTPPDGGLVMVEQPELHIHPALQVKLADLFIAQSASRQLIVETHSEHIILRMLRRIRETTASTLSEGAPRFDPSRLSVLYVEPSATGTKVQRLNVDYSGEFVDRWPKGFFEERGEELF